MLRLYPNDKDIIESRKINLDIYNKNEKRISEIKEKINIFKTNLEEKSKKEEKKDDNKNINDKNIIKKENDEDILKELEL